MVSSFEIITFLATPMTPMLLSSNFNPISSVTTVPPIETAISLSYAFLLSPNDGALTAHTFNPPLSLFKTNVAKHSLSTSSQIIKRALLSLCECSK